MPIDSTYALDELKGEMLPSYTNGDCALGVNNGGKHSVDVTYLAQALATGNVTVATLHNVTDVNGNVLAQEIIKTATLFVNAGTVNTSRLLVAASAAGAISDLPDGVGQGYGTNGDQIYVWSDSRLSALQGGPVVYGSFDWDDPAAANTVIQAALPPVGVDLQPVESLAPGLSALGEPLLVNLNSTMLVGYGVSPSRGQFVYNPTSGTVDLQ